MTEPSIVIVGGDDEPPYALLSIPKGRVPRDDIGEYRKTIEDRVNNVIFCETSKADEFAAKSDTLMSAADAIVLEAELHRQDTRRKKLPHDSPERHAIWKSTRSLARQLKQYWKVRTRIEYAAHVNVILAICNEYGVATTDNATHLNPSWLERGPLLVAYLIALGYTPLTYERL